MSKYIKMQMKDIFANDDEMFVLQLDESTDVRGLAQLLVFIRFIHNNRIIEQFLCCQKVPLKTRGEDILKIVDSFLKENNLQWINCAENENILTTHCFSHREALVAQTIGSELKLVTEQDVKIVNYIKSRPLKSRLFAHICEEMGARFQNLILSYI